MQSPSIHMLSGMMKWFSPPLGVNMFRSILRLCFTHTCFPSFLPSEVQSQHVSQSTAESELKEWFSERLAAIYTWVHEAGRWASQRRDQRAIFPLSSRELQANFRNDTSVKCEIYFTFHIGIWGGDPSTVCVLQDLTENAMVSLVYAMCTACGKTLEGPLRCEREFIWVWMGIKLKCA